MSESPPRTVLTVLVALSVCHLLNDLLQSLLPALYPMLKGTYSLDFWQIGLITLTNQVTSSILQPVVGSFTDRRPQPYSLTVGMGFTLAGLLLFSRAASYPWLLFAAGLTGIGSSIFHPESSRIARLASGGRHGLAQSLFQTGGNFGTSLGPLMAAFIVLPHGQSSVAWFSIVALVAIVILSRIGRWYRVARTRVHAAGAHVAAHVARPRKETRRLILILLMLVFSKYVYISSLVSYYMFFLIARFGISVQNAQLHLFGFLGAVAAGTFIGGPVGDRFGRKPVILISILGVLPFTLALPYANLFWTTVLSVVIGVILSSAFSAILGVWRKNSCPVSVGLVSGLRSLVSRSVSLAARCAAALGVLADMTSITFVYKLCAFLPAIGLMALWLPDVRPHARELVDQRA